MAMTAGAQFKVMRECELLLERVQMSMPVKEKFAMHCKRIIPGGPEAIVKLLLEKGAEVNAQGDNAYRQHQLEVMRQL